MVTPRLRRLCGAGIAAWLTLHAPAKAAPRPRPSHDAAYSTYADYYMRHYAEVKAAPRPTASDPYRYFKLYGYYRSRYGSGTVDPDPYYYFGLYQTQRRQRYREALTSIPKPRMLEAAMRFWHPNGRTAARKDSDGR